jgi:hypothetical protein
VLIESPELYVSHVVKQSGGNPQAIADMLDNSVKERMVDKRQIREMKHQAGVRYLDFTPMMLISGACIIGARYLAIGLGDSGRTLHAGDALRCLGCGYTRVISPDWLQQICRQYFTSRNEMLLSLSTTLTS